MVDIAYCRDCGHHWYPRNPDNTRCGKCKSRDYDLVIRVVVTERSPATCSRMITDVYNSGVMFA